MDSEVSNWSDLSIAKATIKTLRTRLATWEAAREQRDAAYYTAQPAREAAGVDEAMVDRALLAFMGSAAKGAWTYQARMEAALTAALTGDPR